MREIDKDLTLAYWLIKSDPDDYSFGDLETDHSAVWDGVTNNLALIHLRGMGKGDLAMMYHTGKEKSIVGVAEVTSNPYPDPKSDDPKLVVVELRARNRLKHPVPLSAVKSNARYARFDLVRQQRLSVMPVEPETWASLLKLSESRPPVQ